MTLRHVSRAFFASTGLSFAATEPKVRAAYDDCLELLEESMDALSRSLDSILSPLEISNGAVGSTDDVITWLSAALTNHDTCAEGFEDTSGSMKDQMVDNLKDLSELVSNCLAIFSASGSGDFSGVPIQNKRRLMEEEEEEDEETEGNVNGDIPGKFPRWLNKRDRRLLSLPASAIQADIIVSKNGNGTVKTIAEAIKKAPEHSTRRFIVFVRAGR
ncbi:unnamed protein product [Sphenostylis stenocarpa]|uniref:Pectinesterase inhibitor domain-containing protein n=1 Tax=Sphenostylis stenocarpa TaxID=92480 RepID=A0AA86T0U4_9FABA|nr:unnamed protein product [Sphenostylis stenocarpa]